MPTPPPFPHLLLFIPCATLLAELEAETAPRFSCRRIDAATFGEGLAAPGIAPDAAAVLLQWHPETIACLPAVRRVARCHRPPVLVLCGPDPAAQVAALLLGADDLLLLPLSLPILEAKLLALSRQCALRPAAGGDGRAQPPRLASPTLAAPGDAPPHPPDHDLCRVGALVLDRTAHRVFAHDVPLRLTPTEFALLLFFMEHPDACLTRDATLDAVWGIDYAPGTNILDVQVYGLRRKLRRHQLDHHLETVRGVGYRFVSRPQPPPEAT